MTAIGNERKDESSESLMALEGKTRTFHEWTEFLEALRAGEVFLSGRAGVTYHSSYSDEPQHIEGDIEYSSDSSGKPFKLDGKVIKGFHVFSDDGRKIGRVEKVTLVERHGDNESPVATLE